MKKFTMAMLLAALGMGFVACSDDKDDDKDKDKEVTCDVSKCEAVSHATAVAKADGDACKCEYTCDPNYEPEDSSVNDGTLICKAQSQPSDNCDSLQCTVADTNAQAVATKNGDACECVYSCKNGYELAEGAKNDKDIKCALILLENGEACNGDSECKSGYCEVQTEEGDGICAEKKENTDKDDYAACTQDSDCKVADGEYCVNSKCRTATSFHMSECSGNEADFCVGNSLVSCVDSEMGMLYDVNACKGESTCQLNADNVYACVFPEAEVTDACNAENENKKVYTACAGDDDGYGGYEKAAYKKCTKAADGSYSWVESTETCGGTSCLPECPALGCTAYSFCPNPA